MPGQAGHDDKSLPGVVVQDGGVPGLGVDVGVDFGGEDGLVAQHFLDYAEVGAVFDEVRREGMPERVR